MNENKCRMTNHANLLNVTEFNRLACSKCYEFLKYIFIDFHEMYSVESDGYLVSLANNNTLLDLNDLNDVNHIKNSLHSIEYSKWNDCCNEAKKCCTNVMANTTSSKQYDAANSCDTIWDGWSCHKRTLVGQISKVK